jgi:hypothetical protein
MQEQKENSRARCTSLTSPLKYVDSYAFSDEGDDTASKSKHCETRLAGRHSDLGRIRLGTLTQKTSATNSINNPGVDQISKGADCDPATLDQQGLDGIETQ